MPEPAPPFDAAAAAVRSATADLPVLLSYVDRECRYRFVNQTYTRWFERPAEEVQGAHLADVLGPQAFAALRPQVEAALAGERVTFETAVTYAGLGERTIRATYIPDVGPGGEVRGFTACVEDITERKRAVDAQARLAAERDTALRKLETVLDVLPVGVVIAEDAACTSLHGNREVGRLIGVTGAPQGDVRMERGVPPTAARFFARGRPVSLNDLPTHRAARSGRSTGVERLRIQRADGSCLTVTASAVPLRDAEGRCVGAVACYTDVTTLEREAEEAREREAFLRLLADAVPGFLFAAGPDGTLIFVSRTFEEYAGFALADGPGDWRDLVHPEDQPRALPALARAVNRRRPFELEFRLRRHDGEYRSFLIKALPEHEPRRQLRRWVGLALDVTDRIRAEATLRHGEQLQMVGTLAGGVAHEVNNQMSIVLGFGELALRKLGAHLAAREVGHMVEAGHRAAQVSKQLLAFSRRQVLAPVQLDLNEVVLGLAPVLARLLGADKRLRLEPCPDAVAIVADRAQLEQVLVNLAANARDAMPTGGELAIRTEQWHGDDGEIALLVVQDTGVGMTPEVMARAFEPFFTTKPLGQGTGLGLSTVYGIVTQSGGRIELDSVPGEGTTFRIALPVATRRRGRATTRPVRARSGIGLVVLVEDEPALREIVGEVLEHAGYEVRAAEDGEAGLRLLEALEEPPALLLTDLVMPRVNGRELSERLRARWPVPVLFMSGYGGEDAQRRGLLDERSAFVQKPFTPSELLAAVARIIGR